MFNTFSFIKIYLLTSVAVIVGHEVDTTIFSVTANAPCCEHRNYYSAQDNEYIVQEYRLWSLGVA